MFKLPWNFQTTHSNAMYKPIMATNISMMTLLLSTLSLISNITLLVSWFTVGFIISKVLSDFGYWFFFWAQVFVVKRILVGSIGRQLAYSPHAHLFDLNIIKRWVWLIKSYWRIDSTNDLKMLFSHHARFQI